MEPKSPTAGSSLPPELDFKPASAVPPTSPGSSRNYKSAIIIIVILATALAGLFLYRYIYERHQASLPREDITAQFQTYPAAYSEAKLPQYPGAKVTNQSRPDAKLADGVIKVGVQSSDSPEKLQEFFKGELTVLGWQKDSASSDQKLVFTKDNQALTLTTSKNTNTEGDGTGTVATLIWEQKQ